MTNVNLSKILTPEELQWFGQWLSKSQIREGINPIRERLIRDLQRLGGGAKPGGGRVASVWRSVGESFRRRDAELHRRIKSAAGVLRRLNPQASGYEIGQRLFDYSLEPSRFPTLSSQRKWPSFAPRLRSGFDKVQVTCLSLTRELKPGFIMTRTAKSSTSFSRSRTAKPGLSCLVKCEWPMGKFALQPARVPASGNSLGAWHAPMHQESDSHGIRGGYSGRIFVFGQPFVTGRAVNEKNAPFALNSSD